MSAADSGSDRRDTWRRWREVNSADTRSEDGPDGRVYTVPFARIWDELVGMIEGRSRWTLEHQDEELGIITVSCRTPVLRFTDDLTLWVSLDDDGLTRVEALSRSRVGSGDFGANARRISGLLGRLDDRVGVSNRVGREGGAGAQPGEHRGPADRDEARGPADGNVRPSDDGASLA